MNDSTIDAQVNGSTQDMLTEMLMAAHCLTKMYAVKTGETFEHSAFVIMQAMLYGSSEFNYNTDDNE